MKQRNSRLILKIMCRVEHIDFCGLKALCIESGELVTGSHWCTCGTCGLEGMEDREGNGSVSDGDVSARLVTRHTEKVM